MMTPKDAQAMLSVLADGERKNGRSLFFDPAGGMTYCPVCGTSDRAATFEFAVVDARDPITKKDGLVMVFYFNHSADRARRCLLGLAGTPAHGDMAAQLLGHGEALQVMALEERSAGRRS